MGLLDMLQNDPEKREALRMGLLSAGINMLAGGRQDFGTSLGMGFGAGVDMYQGQLAEQKKKRAQQNVMAALTPPAPQYMVNGTPYGTRAEAAEAQKRAMGYKVADKRFTDPHEAFRYKETMYRQAPTDSNPDIPVMEDMPDIEERTTPYDQRGALLQAMLQNPDAGYQDAAMKALLEQQKAASPQKIERWNPQTNQVEIGWATPGQNDFMPIGQGKPEDVKPLPREDVHLGGGRWQTREYNPATRMFDRPIGEPFSKKPTASEVNVSNFPKETFKNERDLRNDFQGLPTTKAYLEVQNSYDQIRFALANPSPANDLTAATKYMKLLDPGSVVRESELGMAMSATGLHDRITNYYDMLKSGKKLTPAQRQDFANAAAGLYAAATERYNQSAAEYRGMAKDYQLNPDRIAKPAQIEKPNKPQAGGLTASEKQELEQLRKRFKK